MPGDDWEEVKKKRNPVHGVPFLASHTGRKSSRPIRKAFPQGLPYSVIKIYPNSRAALLFVAVFPANIQMAVDARNQSTQRKAIAYGRLPLQLPMICSALKIWRKSK